MIARISNKQQRQHPACSTSQPTIVYADIKKRDYKDIKLNSPNIVPVTLRSDLRATSGVHDIERTTIRDLITGVPHALDWLTAAHQAEYEKSKPASKPSLSLVERFRLAKLSPLPDEPEEVKFLREVLDAMTERRNTQTKVYQQQT